MIRSALLSLALIAAPAGAAIAQDNHDHHAGHADHAPDLSPDTAAAASVVDAFHAALASGNTDGALALLSPDVLILESGGAERSREEYAGHHLGSDAAFAAAVPSTVTRRAGHVVGDVAWIVTEGRITGEFNGRAVDRLTTETMVLIRHGETWMVHHIHWSSRAAT